MNNQKIKIIYIITDFNLGGAQRLLLDLIKHLDLKRYDVRVVTVVRGGPLEQEFRELKVPIKIFNKKTKLGLGVLWKIYQYLKKEKPQIVHTHLFAGDSWGRVAAIFARVPIIVSTEHNINLDEGPIKRFVKRVLSYWTNKIIAVSEAVRNYSIQVDKINPKKIEVIYNGICFDKFAPKPKKFGRMPSFGVVGRLEIQKGHTYLLRALNLIKDRQWKLWIIGEGSLRKKLENQVKELGLEERVSFLGSRHDVPELLSKIDIFVLPSLWEGLGIAVLEAAAMEKPIIASRVGGIPEIIEDKKTGLLVEPRDVKGLAEAIRSMITHEDEAREMGKRAREAVVKKFSVEKMAEAYEELYKELTSNK